MAGKTLIVIDMQKDFVTGALGNAECVAAVENVVQLIEKEEYDRILVTYDTHKENYMETREGQKLPVIHCIEGSEGHKLVPEVEVALEKRKKAGTEVREFLKPTFGSFELVQYLKENLQNDRETQIDFCGVCTGICVISNAMLTKAALYEANISIISDACACVTPDTHKTALDAMKLCHIDII